MIRVVFIGAGSVVFTRQLIADLLRFPDLGDLDLVLHDICPERLEVARAVAGQVAGRLGRPLTVRATGERRAALAGADVVVNMIQVGGIEATRIDLELPATFGLRQTIGDTTGVSGVFRGLRTFPVLSAIAREMVELCPDAWFLNYTNPMAMNIAWMRRVAPGIRSVGLCHSVYWTARGLAELVGVDFGRTRYRAAGVNHQAWLYDWSLDGESLYPLLRQAITADPGLERRVRVEMFRRLGLHPTETSEHSSEYLSWFLRDDAQIVRFRLEPGVYLGISEENLAEFEQTRAQLGAGEPVDLPEEDGAAEYAPQIIHSLVTGLEREIHVTTLNQGYVPNLPAGAPVEVPATVDRDGIRPIEVPALPRQCTALNAAYLAVADLAVDAAAHGDRDRLVQALLVDPNASSTLTPARIDALVTQMLAAHQPLMPTTLGGGTRLDPS